MEKFVIVELYAFIAQGPQGEGVAGYMDPATNTMMPLVGADQARVDSLRALAQTVSTVTGLDLTLARFTVRTDLDTIRPNVIRLLLPWQPVSH